MASALALPPVIAEFVARTSEFKAGINEASEAVEKNAARSEAAMARVEAAVASQLETERAAAEAAGLEFDETARKAELMGEKTAAANDEAAESSGRFMTAAKAAVLGAGVVFVGAAVEGIKSAGEYSEALAGVQGSAQLTAKQTKAVGDAFLGTAGTTTVSAQSMATAFAPVAGVVKQLSGGTLTAASSLQVMRAATTASEASGTSLADSTKNLVGVMQAFKLSTGDAAETTNTLYNASRLTLIPMDTLSATVEKLHQKLGPVAPNLTDTSALLVDLANNGVTGSKGVMALNSGMTTLLGGSKATNAELKSLGVSVYNSKGQFVGMQSVIGQLGPKLAGMSQQQKALAEKTLFGAGAANSMSLVLAGGAAGLSKATAAVTAHGAAEAAAAAKAGTLGGQTATLKATVSDLSVKFGQLLLPVLNKVATIVLNVTKYFLKHKDAAIALGIVVGGVLTTAFIAWAASAAAAAAATIAAAAPVLAIVAGIGLLAAGLIYAYTHFKPFRDAVNDVGNVLKDVYNDALKPVVDFLMHNWKDALEVALAVLAPFVGIPVLIIAHWKQIASFFSGLWTDITGVFSDAIKWLKQAGEDIISGLFDGIKAVWNALWTWYVTIPLKIVSALAGAASWLVGKGKDVITGLWNGIKAVWRTVTNWAGGIAGDIMGYLQGADRWLIQTGEDIIKGLVKGIGNMAGAVGGAIKSTLNGIPGVGSVLSHIPGLATGGYVTKPTVALLGEGGEGESVIPDSMWGKLNSNGFQPLTSKIGPAPTPAASSGPPTIVVQVNGSVLGDPQKIAVAVIAAMAQHGSINAQTYQPFGR